MEEGSGFGVQDAEKRQRQKIGSRRLGVQVFEDFLLNAEP
jgi:hypothetical protein